MIQQNALDILKELSRIEDKIKQFEEQIKRHSLNVESEEILWEVFRHQQGDKR